MWNRGRGRGCDPYRRDSNYLDPEERTADLNYRFNPGPQYPQKNATIFVLVLIMVIRGVIKPFKDQLQNLIFLIGFSKCITQIFRHKTGVWHPNSLSLSLYELMSFDQFRKHMNNCKRDRDFW